MTCTSSRWPASPSRSPSRPAPTAVRPSRRTARRSRSSGSTTRSNDPQNSKVGVIPVTGGAHRWVSDGLDRTFYATAGARSPVWLDDDTLLATAEDRGDTHLFRLSIANATTPEALTSGPVCVAGFDAAGGRIAMAQATVDQPGRDRHARRTRHRRHPLVARDGRSSPSRRRTAPTRSTPGSCARPGSSRAASTRSCSTSTAARSRSTARRSSTRPRCRPRPASSS